MKCPHCLVAIHVKYKFLFLGFDRDGYWHIANYSCPSCDKYVFFLVALDGNQIKTNEETGYIGRHKYKAQIRPRGALRPPCPMQVPKEVAEDYTEACLVLLDSPKASAALSRRALQQLLREAAGVKKQDLANEIQEVLNSGKLPSHIATIIDAVRNIGNFSAHPLKSQQTGEILPVEPEEAEWNLEVLESLFDFYYVQPDIIQKKRDALNKKLAEAGKPPMK